MFGGNTPGESGFGTSNLSSPNNLNPGFGVPYTSSGTAPGIFSATSSFPSLTASQISSASAIATNNAFNNFSQSSTPSVFAPPVSSQSFGTGNFSTSQSSLNQSFSTGPGIFGQVPVSTSIFGIPQSSEPQSFPQDNSFANAVNKGHATSAFGAASQSSSNTTSQPSLFAPPNQSSSNTTVQPSLFAPPNQPSSNTTSQPSLFAPPNQSSSNTTSQPSLFAPPNQPSSNTTSQPSLFTPPNQSSSDTTAQPSLFAPPNQSSSNTVGQITFPSSSTAESNVFSNPFNSNSTAIRQPSPTFGVQSREEESVFKRSILSNSATSVFGKTALNASVFSGTGDNTTGPPPTTTISSVFAKTSTSSHSVFGRDIITRQDKRLHQDEEKKSVFQRISSDQHQDKEPPSGDGSDDRDKHENPSKRRIVRKPLASRTPKDAAPNRRRSLAEQQSTKVALHCKNVPASCNNKAELRKHFSKFGQVSHTYPNPRKSSAVIHFKTHDEAAKAKRDGMFIRKDLPPVSIFWSSYTPKTDASQVKQSSSAGDVDDELSSMRGTHDHDPSTSNIRMPHRSDDSKGDLKDDKKPLAKQIKKTKVLSSIRRASPVLSDDVSGKASGIRSISPKPDQKELKLDNFFATLDSLRGRVANSTAERCVILEAYDKLVRQASGSQKHADLASADAIRGTCLDMCPERERYIREERRRLNNYEMISGTEVTHLADHARVVKEYSRSSADQEMPLPHELRPPHVLDMTMHYLLNNIIALGVDGKWADWYEFIWSRTRSIRKDVTQQQLCDPVAVGLIEKCARYHIHCAERLCEEDPSTFDQKINDENLTKCLQTLKEMYRDLDEKGIYCDNEAEFRGYMVLMNLNEGDTIREVQALCPQVRQAQDVRFAVTVYLALNSNNYAKFFRLAKQASYMSGCIMHRYFNQVRQSALLTMTRAYSVGIKGSQFPLSDLVRILAFESLDEAAQFCRHHGLQITQELLTVDRSSFVRPETAIGAVRAMNIIESKLTVSPGEAMNGAPLPSNDIHQPTFRFDSNGRFTAEADVVPQQIQNMETSAQKKEFIPRTVQKISAEKLLQQVVKPSVPCETQRPEPAEKPKLHHVFSNEAVKEVAKELFLEVIDEFCECESRGLVKATQYYLNISLPLCQQIIDSETGLICREIATESMVEEKMAAAEQQARERAEISARRDRVAKSLTDDLIGSVADQLSEQAAFKEFSYLQNLLRNQCEERSMAFLTEGIVTETSEEEAARIADEVYEEVEERRQQLLHAEEATRLMVLARYYRQWRKKFTGRVGLKRSMETFPAAPSMQRPNLQVSTMLPNSCGLSKSALHLGGDAQVTLDGPVEVEASREKLLKDLKIHSYLKQLRHKAAWSPLNMTRAVGRNLQRPTDFQDQDTLFWKLLVALPAHNASGVADGCDIFCSWVTSKLSKGAVSNPDSNTKSSVLSLYTAALPTLSGNQSLTSLGVCVRAVSGHVTHHHLAALERKWCLRGTNAMLFVVTVPENDEEDESFWGEECVRLGTVLQALPALPQLPLLVVCDRHVTNVDHKLQLPLLAGDHSGFTGYHVIYIAEECDRPEPTRQLLEGVQWLSKQSLPQPRLTSRLMIDFVEDVIGKHFFQPVYHDLACRRKAALLDQSPDVIVELYNAAVHHLAEVASCADLTQLSWPPTEFCPQHPELPFGGWNSIKQLSFLAHTLMGLSLPEFDYLHFDSDHWDAACEDIWDYINKVCESEGNTTVLYSRIRWLLQKSRREFERRCEDMFQLDGCDPCYVNVPWTELMTACINYRLSALYQTPLSDQQVLQTGDLAVHYQHQKIQEFVPPESWLQATRDDHLKDVARLSDTVMRAAKRKHEQSVSPQKHTPMDLSPPQTVIGPDDQSTMDFTHSKPPNKLVCEAELLSHTLAEKIHEEKKKAQSYEDYLQAAVDEGECDFLSSTFRCTADVDLTLPDDRVRSWPTTDAPLTAPIFALAPQADVAATKSASLNDTFQDMALRIESMKQSNRLYEMKLQSFLDV